MTQLYDISIRVDYCSVSSDDFYSASHVSELFIQKVINAFKPFGIVKELVLPIAGSYPKLNYITLNNLENSYVVIAVTLSDFLKTDDANIEYILRSSSECMLDLIKANTQSSKLFY